MKKLLYSLPGRGDLSKIRKSILKVPSPHLGKLPFPSLMPLDFIPIWLYIFISIIKAVIK